MKPLCDALAVREARGEESGPGLQTAAPHPGTTWSPKEAQGMRAVVTLALAALAALVLAMPAQATTVARLDDAALIDGAEQVVHGVVVAKTVRALPDGRRVYTEYRLEVRERLKGEGGGSEVVFREWGGRLADGSGLWIPGLGELEVGDEVVIFIGRPDATTGVGFTTGLSQGKFHVRRRGGKAEATRRVGAAPAPEGGEADHAHAADCGCAGEVETRDLDELKEKVRQRVRSHGR